MPTNRPRFTEAGHDLRRRLRPSPGSGPDRAVTLAQQWAETRPVGWTVSPRCQRPTQARPCRCSGKRSGLSASDHRRRHGRPRHHRGRTRRRPRTPPPAPPSRWGSAMPTPPTTWPKRLRSIRRREARRQSATHAVEAGGRTYPLSPLRGVEWPGRMVDFARLIHRPVRVLGGPAVPAACGGNQMPTHSAGQGMPADWGAYDPAGCGTTAAALGRQAAGRLAVACA
jgi:hypothetical protein